jgi:hypothetical protein
LQLGFQSGWIRSPACTTPKFENPYALTISLPGTRFVTNGAPKIENIRLTIMKILFMLHAP